MNVEAPSHPTAPTNAAARRLGSLSRWLDRTIPRIIHWLNSFEQPHYTLRVKALRPAAAEMERGRE